MPPPYPLRQAMSSAATNTTGAAQAAGDRIVKEGELLWQAGPERRNRARIVQYMQWLARERGLEFATFEDLWQWSATDIDAFWQSIWDYFKVDASKPPRAVLGQRTMPGADWFPGAELNYARHMLRHERPNATAVVHHDERRPLTEISWEELAGKVRILATQFRKMGIQRGDRVVAYIPNIPEALIAMLATTSIGAIWSSCGPDFGTPGVLDRFSQLQPSVLLYVDGYQYGGKPFDRRPEVAKIIDKLDTLKRVIFLPYLDDNAAPVPATAQTSTWQELLDHPPVSRAEFKFEEVPFSQPLWILFSSGTTGLPKPIMHSHGGILIEQLKHIAFNFDLRAGERLFFFTTTGWMMWNFLVSSMLSDVVPVLYDGNPTWPDGYALWKVVDQARVNLFGASPTYQQLLRKQQVEPGKRFALAALDTIALAGSPVTPECEAWFYDNVKADMWVNPGSGGTDICSGFCGGVVTLPVYAGEIQARCLGFDLHALDEKGAKVIDEVGEMVVLKPVPSMPIGFWKDDGHTRYRETYFTDFPGFWRQGDFFKVNQRGGCFVLGRSDATLNRHGVRIGTAEIYRSLATLPASTIRSS